MKVTNYIIILVLFGFLFSSEQRINSLGGIPAYWPEDDQIVDIFPQFVNNFNLFQVSNLSDSTSPTGRLILGEKNKFGFTITDGIYGQEFGFLYGFGNWGIKTSITAKLVENSYTDALPSAKNSAFSEAEISSVLGIGRQFGNLNLSWIQNNWFNAKDNWMGNYNTATRGLYKWNEDVSLYFSGTFSKISDDDFYDKGREISITYIKHYTSISNTDILLAVGLDNTGELIDSSYFLEEDYYEYEKSSGLNEMVVTMAIENKLKEWLNVRISLIKIISSLTETESEKLNEDELYSEETKVLRINDLVSNLGVGFKYKSFLLDLEVSPHVIINPIQVVSGYDEFGSVGTATITYKW